LESLRHFRQKDEAPRQTILSLKAIQQLRVEESLTEKARKLLSFTDNRQDAALQAGHFNDFVEISLIRSALYEAVRKAGPNGVRHDELTQKVFDALKLPLSLYAARPEARYGDREEAERAFREVLGHRLYRDLKRGWRVTSPNLEQAGLLEIRYPFLKDLTENHDDWKDCHPALTQSKPETRFRVAKALLDYLRRELVIKVSYLEPRFVEQLKQLSAQYLKEPWSIDENENLERTYVLFSPTGF
jgi:hypothetical protein